MPTLRVIRNKGKSQVSHFIKFFVSLCFPVLLSLPIPTEAREVSIKVISHNLERYLNNRDTSELEKLVSKEISISLKKEYQDFLKKFPNAKWTITPGEKLKGNRESINLYITAKKEMGVQKYSLEAKQKLAISHKNNRIIKKETLSESSVLQSIDSPLEVTINIPDVVLTGAKYDIDIVLEKPLKEAIIAAGLISMSSPKTGSQLMPNIQLAPMGSGGLFKSTQAPLKPGIQRWAALIAHPDGLISITKMVRVVSKSSEMAP